MFKVVKIIMQKLNLYKFYDLFNEFLANNLLNIDI